MRVRPERVAQQMRREIAELLEHKMRDPRLGTMISVTDVEVTQDLSSAKVYVSVLATGDERERALSALDSAKGFIRHALGDTLGLREVPDLRFLLDTSIETGARVDEILRKLANHEPIDPETS
jgi:ribosome-binding factor A